MRGQRTCSIDGCGKPYLARGFCGMHYERWRRHGSAEDLRPIRRCAIEGCDSPPGKLRRGWCTKHYQRWQKYGDPGSVTIIRGDDEARFWSKVTKTPGCWLWEGWTDPDGYGRLGIAGRFVAAHRWSYERHVGPIPEELTIDHLCHNADPTCTAGSRCPHRRCVNPAHLEPAANRVNILRGNGVTARQARQTHCKRGHEFTPENTYTPPGRQIRACKTCMRTATRLYLRRRRAEARKGSA